MCIVTGYILNFFIEIAIVTLFFKILSPVIVQSDLYVIAEFSTAMLRKINPVFSHPQVEESRSIFDAIALK